MGLWVWVPGSPGDPCSPFASLGTLRVGRPLRTLAALATFGRLRLGVRAWLGVGCVGGGGFRVGWVVRVCSGRAGLVFLGHRGC